MSDHRLHQRVAFGLRQLPRITSRHVTFSSSPRIVISAFKTSFGRADELSDWDTYDGYLDHAIQAVVTTRISSRGWIATGIFVVSRYGLVVGFIAHWGAEVTPEESRRHSARWFAASAC